MSARAWERRRRNIRFVDWRTNEWRRTYERLDRRTKLAVIGCRFYSEGDSGPIPPPRRLTSTTRGWIGQTFRGVGLNLNDWV